jgi:DNA-binding transcriptional MerR regulator
MSAAAEYLSPSEAARRLGVSAKALRLYEQRGLVAPVRTAAGWRAYGPEEMSRASEIAALRALGLSLAQVAHVLQGDPAGLEPALASHQAMLEAEMRGLAGTIERIRGLRADLALGRAPAAGELPRLMGPAPALGVAFDLPWPWGGERFELSDIRAITYLIGPLGSGKTRLAMRLAKTLPDAVFLPMERADDGGIAARSRLAADPGLAARVEQALAWLADEGAEPSDALLSLLVGLEADGPRIRVVDLVEHGLSAATQEALVPYLRRRGTETPLFVMTRSTAILDLATIGPDEAILYCPANHSPPFLVTPIPGASGYEAVATCLASPEVRARTEGVIALRPEPRRSLVP